MDSLDKELAAFSEGLDEIDISFDDSFFDDLKKELDAAFADFDSMFDGFDEMFADFDSTFYENEEGKQ